MTNGERERVYTVTDYYDGPRCGIANFRGRPHLYESDFDDDTFRLYPVAADLLQLALEDWAIWVRWSDAFNRGEVDASTHPAHPADRTRHEELAALLDWKRLTDSIRPIVAHGTFEADHSVAANTLTARGLWVRWTPVDGKR